ncbi:hypothetical protein PMR90_07500, partial [Bifidobacterium longum]|nr:hypothetical protein [Bifidobacterium longum]MDB6771978.1 hypothetical protein [Bifidobacterium longum]
MDDTRDEVGEILAGMTGGRTGTAGGVSSPVPPAADWPRGLDAASASAARLTMLLSDVYKAHQGKEPSASLAAQIEQTVRNLTGEPPQECFASMFVRQVRQCFSAVWADGFPRCR